MEKQTQNRKHIKDLIHFASSTLDEPKDYSEKYLAFIDILGFKEIVRSQSSEWIINNIYNEIRKVEVLIHSDLLINMLPQTTCNQLEFVLISDSITISIQKDLPLALETLISACIMLQKMFLNKEQPILMRGAITTGNYFHYDQMTFGPALSNAYILESNVAIFPRILIDKSVRIHEICNQQNTLAKAFCVPDTDGYEFLDYVNFALAFASDRNKECAHIRTFIVQRMREFIKEDRIYQKYAWLAEKFNNALSFHKDINPSLVKKYNIPV